MSVDQFSGPSKACFNIEHENNKNFRPINRIYEFPTGTNVFDATHQIIKASGWPQIQEYEIFEIRAKKMVYSDCIVDGQTYDVSIWKPVVHILLQINNGDFIKHDIDPGTSVQEAISSVVGMFSGFNFIEKYYLEYNAFAECQGNELVKQGAGYSVQTYFSLNGLFEMICLWVGHAIVFFSQFKQNAGKYKVQARLLLDSLFEMICLWLGPAIAFFIRLFLVVKPKFDKYKVQTRLLLNGLFGMICLWSGRAMAFFNQLFLIVKPKVENAWVQIRFSLDRLFEMIRFSLNVLFEMVCLCIGVAFACFIRLSLVVKQKVVKFLDSKLDLSNGQGVEELVSQSYLTVKQKIENACVQIRFLLNGQGVEELVTELEYDKVKDFKFSRGDKVILLTGPCGSGKSTLINSLANYLKPRNLSQSKNLPYAENFNPVFKIPCSFQVEDLNGNEVSIVVGKETKDERFYFDKSQTQKPKIYVFNYGSNKLILIDTPGFSSSNSIEENNKNMKQIFSCLSLFKEIHGVCVLLKPNRLTLPKSFKDCFTKLLSRFPSANKNVTFCFTKARDTAYSREKTRETLETFFNELKQSYNIDVNLTKENMFRVENCAFQYLWALKQGVEFDDFERKKCVRAWNESFLELERLFDYVSKIEPFLICERKVRIAKK